MARRGAPGRRGRAPLRRHRRRVDRVVADRRWCSRPTRPGSIAAISPRSSAARRGPVLPADEAGLHCGHDSGRTHGTRGRHRCSRPTRPGSIAARSSSPVGGNVQARCSRPTRPGSIAARLRVAGQAGRGDRQCSRPTRPGSIAAWSTARRAGDLARWCSRPTRPGSIAAVDVASADTVARRAVLPADEAGLHCGGTMASHAAVTTGCQCSRPTRPGSIAASATRAAGMPTRRRGAPGRRGRAPLRHTVGTGRADGRRQRAPGRRGRAPLRRRSADDGEQRPSDAVLPADEAGLHCGLHGDTATTPSPSCAPGRRGRAPLRPPTLRRDPPCDGAGSVLPADEAGLHCGTSCAPATSAVTSLRCSRPTRPGSIAAGRRSASRSTTGRQRCSRPTRPGSIAALNARRHRASQLPQCSRPTRPGSIAAVTRVAADDAPV